MDNLECNGTEGTLENCKFDGWGKHSCGDGEVAAVRCEDQWSNKEEGMIIKALGESMIIEVLGEQSMIKLIMEIMEPRARWSTASLMGRVSTAAVTERWRQFLVKTSG